MASWSRCSALVQLTSAIFVSKATMAAAGVSASSQPISASILAT